MNTSKEKSGGENLSLPFGLSFRDLYDQPGLIKLDSIFLEELGKSATELRTRLVTAREQPESLNAKQSSELMIELAPYVEDFIGELFGIQPELRELQARHHELRRSSL